MRKSTEPGVALLAEAVRRLRQGDLAGAASAYDQVLASSPNHPTAAYNLALLHIARSEREAARLLLERLIEARPDHGSAHYTLAKLLQEDGALSRCAAHLRAAARLEPNRIETYLELIFTEGALGRLAEAKRIAARAAERFPGRAEVAIQLGTAAAVLGQTVEARRQFKAAVALAPHSALALYSLGKLADSEGDLATALKYYSRAHDADPEFEPASFNLGDLALRLGDADAAIKSFEASLARHPDDPAALSNLFMAEQYRPGVTADSLAQLHRAWDARIGDRLRPASEHHDVTRDPATRLRVGFVSPDFRQHPVAFFIIRPIEALNPDAIELICYNTGTDIGDAMTARFKRAAAHWRDVAGLSDEAIAETIRRDRVDILVDLTGHIAGNRLAIFARRPAPLQLTWMGYVGTTGLTAMDGLIADVVHVPPGEDAAYTEKILRLPDSCFCFEPAADAPAVSPLPALSAKRVTFGCLNNPAKVNRGVVALWARILKRLPDARLFLAYAGYDVPSVQSRIVSWFAEAGIAGERIRFGGRSPRREHLARYRDVDLALDTMPYSGSTTTADALWMGVPVITMPGESFAGRHSTSHQTVIGLTETIASDTASYVEIACGLAADLPRLAELRVGLRDRVAASPLCNGPRFAQHLAAAFRTLWREWCSTGGGGIASDLDSAILDA